MDYILASYLAWQGRPVTRPGWPEGAYAVLKGASPHIFIPGSPATVWHSTKEDRFATDFREIIADVPASSDEDSGGPTDDSEASDNDSDLSE
jgi:hypothetical protein